jgi:hypothetical protein
MMSTQSGWIILSIIFLLIIITSLCLIAYCLYLLNRVSNPICFGAFGVQPRTGAKILTQCGTNRKTICAYHNVGGLNGAIKQCDVWTDLCTAFVYDPFLDTMAIVDPNNTFNNGPTDLYVRQ